MKKVLIHQPYKYGDYITLIGMVQKLIELGYEVYYPYSYHTKDLIEYLEDINFFEIGPISLDQSIDFCEKNNVKLINCQSPNDYEHLSTVNDGHLFIEELKYYVAEDILKCGLKYSDKYNLKWKRNYEKEEKLKNILNIKEGDEYNVSHLIGDNGRTGCVPNQFLDIRNIEITKIHGFCMFDWYPIILNSKNIFAIQSSGYSFIDSIHKHLPHKNLFLLNDTCEVDRLLVPTYNWNVDFFINKRLK
jgi:hypothetical protein